MNSNYTKKAVSSFVMCAAAAFLLFQMPGFAGTIEQNDNDIMMQQAFQNGNYSKYKNLPIMRNKQGISDNMINMQPRFSIFAENCKIDLTLRDVDVASVLRIVAKEGGKNIVLDKSVQGTISAELKNVSLNEAMKAILTSEELEYRTEGNTIFIASRPSMARKGLNRNVIKAFRLNNSNSIDIAKLLEASIFNKGYKVNSESTGASSSSASGATLQSLESDSPVSNVQPAKDQTASPQVKGQDSSGQSSVIGSKTIRGKVETLVSGQDFNDANKPASQIKIQGVNNATGDVVIDNNDNGAIVIPDTRTNSVLIVGTKEDVLMAEQAIKYLDKPLSQVSIQVKLVEVKKDDIKNLGLNSLSLQDNKFNAGFNLASDSVKNISGLQMDTVQRLNSDMLVKLQALIQNQKAILLANPNLIAMDGSESLIKITDRIISKMDITQTQTTTTYSPTLEDIGITLNVLPKINDQGFVTMRLRPSITTPLEKETYGDKDNPAYATMVATREILIQDVRVKSGQTLALAGLVRQKDLEIIGRIPLLSDLPILGKLFQNKEFTKTNTELIILITPTIINDDSNATAN